MKPREKDNGKLKGNRWTSTSIGMELGCSRLGLVVVVATYRDMERVMENGRGR